MESVILSSYDVFRKTHGDNFGGIRVKKVQKFYGYENHILSRIISLKALQEIADICHTWINEVELIPMKKVFLSSEVRYIPELNVDSEKYLSYLENHNVKFSYYNNHVFLDVEKFEWCTKICVKRGNKPYLNIVRDKFKPLERWAKTDEAKKRIGFSTIINKNRKRVRKAKLFFITLTCDHDKIKTVGESWLKSGKLTNSYLTYLRQSFPGIKFFIAPQAQKNGYFHPHILAYVPNSNITVYPHKEFNNRNKKWEYVWRISNRQKHNGRLILDIFKSWNYGFSDVRAVDNLNDGLTEVLKYVTRDLTGGEYNLTLGALWFFNKPGYSMSKGFVEALTGKTNIELAEPTNDYLIKAEGFEQSNASKQKLIRIEVFPQVLEKNLDFSYQKDVLDPLIKPDPPPNVVNFFNKLADSCVPVSVKKHIARDGYCFDVVVFKYSDDVNNSGSTTGGSNPSFVIPCSNCGGAASKCVLGVWVCNNCLRGVD